jgi:hypothetical protein
MRELENCSLKTHTFVQAQWLMPIILTTQGVKIRKTSVKLLQAKS